MKIAFVYPRFDRHADSHPELRECVPCDEYLGSPSLGIAMIGAVTPPEHEMVFIDDRVHPFNMDSVDADLYAFSFFTPAATRAFEIADALRAAGRTVVAGGIFPSALPEVAEQHFDAVVVGEGEPVWPQLLADVEAGTLKRRYQAEEPQDLSLLPPPRIDLYVDAENPDLRPDDYPLQLSRGCPLKCDACVLPLSMTKKLRVFPREHYLAAMKDLAASGKLISITEDTSIFPFGGVRRAFRKFLEDLADMERLDGKEDGESRCSYLGISMPMVRAVSSDLLKSAYKAGITRFYLVCGFDPITRGAFGPGDPENVRKAEEAIARCHEFGIEPYASLLVGNDGDDEGTFDRILEFAHRTKIEKAEFAIYTPYPGTPVWHEFNETDRILTRDWHRYNDANVVFKPAQMSPERLQEGYLYMWREFYKSKGHLQQADHANRTIQF